MNKLLTLTFVLPLALAGCSGKNAKSCTTTTSGDTQTITCPDGTTATTKTATNGANGTSTLVDVVDEPAGTNCPYGGKAIETGTDTNDDGILQSTEVTSTSYVCQTTPSPATTIEGDIDIQNSLQVAALAGVTTITGNLTIEDLQGTVSLPSLQHVTGNLDIESNGHLVGFTAPALTAVDGNLQIDGDETIATLDLTKVATVGSLGLDEVPISDLSFLSSLQSAVNGISITNSAVVTLSPIAAAFATVTGDISIEDNEALSDVAALGTVVAPNNFYYYDNGATTLALTKLTSVAGQFDIESDNVLTSITAPVLGGVYSLYLEDLDALTTVSFPTLSATQGDFIVSADTKLTGFSVPLLASTGGDFQFEVNDTATALSLPKLLSAGRFFVGGNNSLSSLVLASVSATTKLTVGYFAVDQNPALSQCDIDALYANTVSANGAQSSGNMTCNP